MTPLGEERVILKRIKKAVQVRYAPAIPICSRA